MAAAFVVVAVLLLQGVTSFQWSNNVQDGDLLYACVDGDIHLDWQYQLGPGENVFSINWWFKADGQPQDMIAMSTHGAFVALPTFGHRVTQTTNAGIVLHKVTTADNGHFWVEISGQDANGAFTVNKTIQLQVADNLLTTDHQLHVTQSSSAVHNDVTDTWHLQLNCGTFTYAGYPPFEVQWISPSGQRYNSTNYSNHQFHLLVPNPVEEGSYTCEVPATASLACLPHGQSSASEYAVHGVLARLTLLEAEQAHLRQQNTALFAENQQLMATTTGTTQRLTALETTILQQQQVLVADQKCCHDNQANLTSLLASLNALQQQQATDKAALTSQIQTLTGQISQIQTVGSAVSAAKVAFHTKLAVDSRRHTLTQGTTFLNLGHGLDATATFVAPETGTYFFVASSGDRAAVEGGATPTFYLPLQLIKQGVKVAEGVDVVHAVMDLQQGQHVQVEVVAAAEATLLLRHPDLVAYFSGFLLHN